MEDISDLYYQIKNQPRGFHAELDMKAFADIIRAEFLEIKASLFGGGDENKGEHAKSQPDSVENFENLPEAPGFTVSDPKRIFLENARLIRNAELEQGTVLVPQEAYLHGYKDLSCEEFNSYIYWRTAIRNNKVDVVKDTPRGFLYLYLCELANFVEYSTVEETMFAFSSLLAMHPNRNYTEMI